MEAWKGAFGNQNFADEKDVSCAELKAVIMEQKIIETFNYPLRCSFPSLILGP